MLDARGDGRTDPIQKFREALHEKEMVGGIGNILDDEHGHLMVQFTHQASISVLVHRRRKAGFLSVEEKAQIDQQIAFALSTIDSLATLVEFPGGRRVNIAEIREEANAGIEVTWRFVRFELRLPPLVPISDLVEAVKGLQSAMDICRSTDLGDNLTWFQADDAHTGASEPPPGFRPRNSTDTMSTMAIPEPPYSLVSPRETDYVQRM
jgi:hypothetical protein